MMKSLGKRIRTSGISIEANEGERDLLPSSKTGVRSPSLAFKALVTDEMLVDELARILVDGFF